MKMHQASLRANRWFRSRVERTKLGVQQEQGSSLLEFALALPAMLLVVTGITTFGLALNNYVSLTDATNSGARQLAISRGSTNDPCALVAGVVENAAPYLTPGNLNFTLNLNGNSYTGTGSSSSGFSCSSSSTTSGAAANLLVGKKATLEVTYPCNLQVFRANYSGTNCQLYAMTTQVIQ